MDEAIEAELWAELRAALLGPRPTRFPGDSLRFTCGTQTFPRDLEAPAWRFNTDPRHLAGVPRIGGMAGGTVATAAGVAVMLCFVAGRKSAEGAPGRSEKAGREEKSGKRRRETEGRPRGRRMGPRPEKAPAWWGEALAIAAATIRFAYAETVGKWGIAGLAFGIKDHMRRYQDSQQFARVYAGSNCIRLKGPEITTNMIQLLRLLTICMLFTKKQFPVFLESSGYSREDVIIEEHKAGVLKPKFTVICDRSSQCFLLFIRGALSIKDKLTAATGEMIPFRHLTLHEDQVDSLVIGYAHCGMVAAARWIARRTTPFLLQAVRQNPDFKIKIIGHSMGAGIAAILTYILREHEEFSSSTCIAFGPAACMTWDLAESGKHFVTSVVNCTDLVPTFSPATINDLHSEIRAASRANSLQEPMQCTQFCNIVYRSATALGSHMQCVCSPKATGASNNEDIAQAIALNHSSVSAWSCMGVGRHATSKRISDSLVIGRDSEETTVNKVNFCCSASLNHKVTDEKEELIPVGHAANVSVRDISGGELWLGEVCQGGEEKEATAVKGIVGDVALEAAAKNKQQTLPDALERHQFYPPGRIMHIVMLPTSNANSNKHDVGNEDIGIFETPRELYSKIRLAETMIKDHYMPRYIKMMEQLIDRLKNDDGVLPSASASSKPFAVKIDSCLENESRLRGHHERNEQNCVISCQSDANYLR